MPTINCYILTLGITIDNKLQAGASLITQTISLLPHTR